MNNHRIFHYDPDSGRSTPVEEVRLADRSIVLVPVEKGQRVKREAYGIADSVSQVSAAASIEQWESDED